MRDDEEECGSTNQFFSVFINSDICFISVIIKRWQSALGQCVNRIKHIWRIGGIKVKIGTHGLQSYFTILQYRFDIDWKTLFFCCPCGQVCHVSNGKEKRKWKHIYLKTTKTDAV